MVIRLLIAVRDSKEKRTVVSYYPASCGQWARRATENEIRHRVRGQAPHASANRGNDIHRLIPRALESQKVDNILHSESIVNLVLLRPAPLERRGADLDFIK